METKQILATFLPQAWIDDYAVEIDGRDDVDVTQRVLGLSLAQIHHLQDHRASTDDLLNGSSVALEHDGPFTVYVVDNICAFFGVTALSDITEQMLADARLAAKPVQPGMIKIKRLKQDGRLQKGDLVETLVNGVCEVAWIRNATNIVVRNAMGLHIELSVNFPTGARVTG